jgi:hypothetical protein
VRSLLATNCPIQYSQIPHCVLYLLVPVALSSLKLLLACCSDLFGSNNVPQVHSSLNLNVTICLTLQNEVLFYSVCWQLCVSSFLWTLVSIFCPFICIFYILQHLSLWSKNHLSQSVFILGFSLVQILTQRLCVLKFFMDFLSPSFLSLGLYVKLNLLPRPFPDHFPLSSIIK